MKCPGRNFDSIENIQTNPTQGSRNRCRGNSRSRALTGTGATSTRNGTWSVGAQSQILHLGPGASNYISDPTVGAYSVIFSRPAPLLSKACVWNCSSAQSQGWCGFWRKMVVRFFIHLRQPL